MFLIDRSIKSQVLPLDQFFRVRDNFFITNAISQSVSFVLVRKIENLFNFSVLTCNVWQFLVQ